MTQQEQIQIVRKVIDLCASGYPLGQRARKWAFKTFCYGHENLDTGSVGWCIQYRVADVEQWVDLKSITVPNKPTESAEDRRAREVSVMGTFSANNVDTSNNFADVTLVRCVPFVTIYDRISNTYSPVYKEDEELLFPCTDTGERRQWNHLDIRVDHQPSCGIRSYHLVKEDIHVGDDLCWYQPWNFCLEPNQPCPVAPIIVEEADDYHLVIRYKDQRVELSTAVGKRHAVVLESDVNIQPVHNWFLARMPQPFRFSLTLDLKWQSKLYGSTDKADFQTIPPQQYFTSDLPAGVRTMQQIDHDAWEEATGRRFCP